MTDKVQIRVTFYHQSSHLDVENMSKPIQDALCGIVFVDDSQVIDRYGHRRRV